MSRDEIQKILKEMLRATQYTHWIFVLMASCTVILLGFWIFHVDSYSLVGVRRKSALFAIGGQCSYRADDTVAIKVNSMWSPNHPNEPLDFYETLPFCRPTQCDEYSSRHENLAEILMGQRYDDSPFQDTAINNASQMLPGVRMLHSFKDRVICHGQYTVNELDAFAKRVSQRYRARLVVDDLPCIELEFLRNQHNSLEMEHVSLGYQLGVDGRVFTKLDIVIQYHECGTDDTGEPMYNIVGFITTPHTPVETDAHEWDWTYSLSWEPSDTEYASRFDPLLKPNHEVSTVQIAYFVVALVTLFVSAASIYHLVHASARRVLSAGDFKPSSGARHSVDYQNNKHVYEPQQDPEAQRRSSSGGGISFAGWKHIGEFVFRPPEYRQGFWLSILVATGIQLTTILFILSAAGFASITFVRHRLAILNIAILCYVILSTLSGYVCARLTLTLLARNSAQTKRNAMFAGFAFYPGVVLSILFLVNQLLAFKHSTTVIDLYTSVIVIGVILIVSLLCYVSGCLLGNNQGPYPFPLESAEESRKREIPYSVFSQENFAYYFIQLTIGFTSYCIIAVALMFVYDSVWGGHIYSMFTILWVCVFAWLFATGAMDMAFIHFQLSAENYDWWLPSFTAPASMGMFVCIHSVVYACFFSPVESFTSNLIYFGYALILSISLAIVSGSTGFLMCKYLVVGAYASVKSS